MSDPYEEIQNLKATLTEWREQGDKTSAALDGLLVLLDEFMEYPDIPSNRAGRLFLKAKHLMEEDPNYIRNSWSSRVWACLPPEDDE